MTAAKLDPRVCRRLAVECAEDDASLPRAPFISNHDGVQTPPPGYKVGSAQVRCDAATDQVPSGCLIPFFVLHHTTADAIARTRNNLPAIAAQLTAAAELQDETASIRSEVEQLRTLVQTLQFHTEERDALRAQLATAERALVMPPVRGRGGKPSERDGSATDAQRAYLRRLLHEAFSNLHDHRTGLDPHHLDRVSAAAASRAIDALKAAKTAGWPRQTGGAR